jgi:GWxTD domain-containing protein
MKLNNWNRTYRFLKTSVPVFLLLSIFGCKTQSPVAEKTSLSLFTKNAQDIPTSFDIFNYSPDSSKIFIKLNTSNLLYAKNELGELQASVLVRFEPLALDSPKTELPEKKIRIIDIGENGVDKVLLSETEIYLPNENQYQIKVTITDENRLNNFSETITCDNTFQSRSHFIVEDSLSASPIFTDRIKANYKYNIESTHGDYNDLEVRYYNRTFGIPPPPFVPYIHEKFDYEADSIFSLQLGNGWQTSFRASNKGFYHFQIDSTRSNKGLSLFISSDEFPYVKTIENMVEPFRYLVSKKDYEKVINAENPRAELENYWIDWSGNKERARAAIESYYTRIEEANQLFSSHVEGWKTDRGIVYAVYGRPNKVYTNNSIETWIYGEEHNPLSITFNFVQVINPFTDNDYRLIRDEVYKPSWYHALNACRYGKN